jgi:HK97 family phage prohead protease
MEYREFRAEVTSAEGNHLSGILAPFNSETIIGRLDHGGWREEIAPGAFTKALQEGDTVLLCDHDMSKPLARVSAGTLRLEERDNALHFDADVVDTSYARDVMVNVRAKNKKGMSIGFEPVKDEWRDDEGRPATRRTGTRRTLREVKLPEGSVVTNPAYGKTNVYARDDSAALLEERERDADAIVGDYIVILEDRASSIDAATRRKYAAKGWALHDGSYPIPDEDHLHAAAVLAASGHGDVEAAKALIQRRAKELGVDVTTLPGFGKESKSEGLPGESRDQEPGASTPEHEDPDRALRDAELRRLESRHLGL